MTESDTVPNLDALELSELKAWRRRWSPFVSCGHLTDGEALAVRRQHTEALAAEMFPTKPPGYRQAFENLKAYATLKQDAMSFRLAGKIPTAVLLEARADLIYEQLPNFARW